MTLTTIEMAWEAYQRNDNGIAARLFAVAAAADSTNPTLWRGLGLALFADGWFDEAAEAFDHAVMLDPAGETWRFDRNIAQTLGALLRGKSPSMNPFTELRPSKFPKAPHIILIIPVFNTNPAYLNECLRSVRAQTLQPARVVIVDDGSTFPATKLFLRLAAEAPDVDLLVHDENRSLGPTMNTGIAHANTPYVVKLDSDDIARPNLLSRFAEDLALRGDADVIGCQMRFFGRSTMITNHPLVVTKRDVVRQPGYWFLNNTGVLLNRESVQSIGGYKALPRLPDDYDLWIRLLKAGRTRIRNLPEVLMDYRDLSGGLHNNYRRVLTRLFLISCKTKARFVPAF